MVNALGRYRIVRPLGQGGMGQVYLADDDRLRRQIAIKVLPPHLVGDPERRHRFEREAQAIAALNHPNIVTIFSIEESEGLPFLTMEYVTGIALGALTPRGGMPLDRLLTIGIPLAEAVAAAHAKGIVHRDLKPANVMVDDDGRVRVLDFGLARLAETDQSTITDPSLGHCAVGDAGGTAAYMSPEQAEGQKADQRSDIFSLGVLLYEMACGERPFRGQSAIAVLAEIVNATPRALLDVNPGVAPEFTRIVRRCLAKDPEQRYQTAKDLRNDLVDVRASVSSSVQHAAWTRWFTPRLGAVALAALVIVAGAAIAVDRVARARSAASGNSLDPLPQLGPVAEVATPQTLFIGTYFSVSPDGQWVAYAAGVNQRKQDIFLQSVHGQRSFNLTSDHEASNRTPRFSPDGEHIAFRSERDGGGVFIMGRTGESVTRLTDFGYWPAWSPDGKRLVVASLLGTDDPRNAPLENSTLWIVTALSGDRRRLPVFDGLQPAWSPDGTYIAYWGRDRRDGPRQIFAIRPDGTGRAQITDGNGGDFSPAWSPDGRYLFFLSDRGGRMNMWRVRFDHIAGSVLGRPQAVTLPSPYVASVTVSAAGRVGWMSNESTTYLQSLAIDRRRAAGAPPTPSTLLASATQFWDIDLSPDGSSIVLSAMDGGQLFVCRIDGTGLRQLTTRSARHRYPHWSADGDRIAFSSEDLDGRWGFWSIAADGSNLQRVQLPVVRGLAAWSPDGVRFAATDLSESPLARTRAGRFDGGRAATQETLPEMPGTHAFVATDWSPDGTRLAGHLTISGGVAIYSFATHRYDQVTDRGLFPIWFHDGRGLLFQIWNPPALVAADLETGKTFPLFSGDAAVDVVSSVRLTHDDRQAYFLRSRVSATIWTADLK